MTNLSKIESAVVDLPLFVIPTHIRCLSNNVLGLSSKPFDGKFENFAKASEAVAVAISRATKNGAISIVGGGDTSSFVLNWIEKNPEVAEFSLISTGGGAALELMSGNSLPGLEILPDK